MHHSLQQIARTVLGRRVPVSALHRLTAAELVGERGRTVSARRLEAVLLLRLAGRHGPRRSATRHRVMQLGRRRYGPPVASGRLGVGRSEEAGRQFAVLVGAGRRSAGVHVVQDTEQSLEVRVAVTAHVDDLVAMLFGADAALR